MKQTTTTQQKSPGQQYLRLYGLILTFLLAGVLGLQAQKVTWTSGYPQTVPATLVALGDPGAIEVNFTVTQAIANAKLEVSLPANVAYASVSNGASLTPGITYTASATGAVATGQTVTIAISSNGNSLPVGKVLHLKVNVNAQCVENTTLTAGIKVISGSTEIASDTRSVPTPVRKPVIRLQCASPTIAGGATSTTKSFSMTLDAQNVTANSFKIVFSTDQYTTLSNFKLGATSLTETAAGTTTKTYTLLFNTTNMGGVLGTTAKTLTFDVVSTRCGAHNITSAIQYPEASACATATGTPLSISYDGVSGTPYMTFVKANWVDPNDLSTPITAGETSLDGTTPAWLKVEYKNTGTVDSYNTTIWSYTSWNEYGYLDVDNVQYAIGAGAKKILKDNGKIVANAYLVDLAYRTLKTSVLGKCRDANFIVTEAIPAGATIYMYIPVIQGAIFDNSSMGSIINTGTPNNIQTVTYRASRFENACGVSASNANWVGSSGTMCTMIPRIGSQAKSISLRPGGATGSTQFKFYSSIGNAKSTDINIELPSWLELDGTLSNALTFSSAVTTTEILSDDVNKKYTLRLSSSFDGTVTLKYKSIATCPDPVNENKEDEVKIRVDLNTSNGVANRPPLVGIAQLVIPATLLCKEVGFVMDNFSIIRTTKGLTDGTDKKLAEDGSVAADVVIDHNTFILNDEGKMVYDGHIAGSSSNTFDYLYVLISSKDANFSSNLILSQATLQIGSNSYPVSFIQAADNKHYYLKYTGIDIKGGSIVKVTLPFKDNYTYLIGITLTAEAYASNDDIPAASVFTPTSIQRNGEDVMYGNIFSYSLAIARDINTGAVTVSDNVTREFTMPYLSTFQDITPPRFTKEYRVVAVPKRIEITVPDGILLDEATPLRMYASTVQDAHAQANRNQSITLSSVTTVSGGKKYVYDFSSVYNPSYDLTQGALPATQWAYPAERWLYYWYPTMTVTRGAAVNNIVSSRVYYDEKTTNTEKYIDSSPNISYTGPRSELTVSPTATETYSTNVNIPSVIPGNATSSPMRMWLYIEGDVENAKVTPVGGGTTISGTGYNNCWIPLGTVAANGAPAYNLDFTYTGSGNCDPYEVKVHTLADFGDGSYNPATGSAMVFDATHNGAYKTITITPNPNAALVGSLSVPASTVLSYQAPYTVTAIFKTLASEAGVNHAEMLITVPAGQQYVANSAKFVYPTTASSVVAAAIESALVTALGSSSDLTVARTFALKAADLGITELPGYKVTGFSDIARELKVTMDFTSECGTELNGIRFTGTFSGKNPCGGAIVSSDVRTEQLIYTNVTAAYAFDVTAAMDATGPVFNEKKTTGTLTVTAQKLGSDPVQTSDYVMITLPEALDVTGNATSVTLSGTLPGVTTATVTSNTAALGIRTLKLTLPASVFTGATNGGNGLNVVYTIPLTYTPSAQTYAATPLQKIEPRVLSNQKFNSACSGTSEAAIGHTELNLSLVTALANSHIACLKSPAALEITSAGFTGSWYSKQDRTGSVLSTTATYTYTPSVQQDTTFYVSAIFGGVDYGTVPVKVQMNPQVSLTVSNPASICLGSSVDLKLAVTGSTNSTDTVYLASDKSTVISNPLVTPTAVGAATYYILTKNSSTSCVSDTMTVTFNVNTKPAVAPITLPAAICEGSALTLPTLTVTAQGTPVTAQVWKLAGTTYTAGTLLTYADNGKSLTFTASSACGDSIVTVGNITVNAKPTVAPITLPAAICEGSALTLPSPTVAARGTAITAQTWKLAGTAYTAGTALTYADNGKSLTFTASSACGDSIIAVGNITVNAKPTVAPITLPAAICEGSALTLPTPTVAARGTAITAQTWKLAGTAYTAGTTLTYADNGKSLTFTASSACGDSIVTVGNIIVNAKPTVAPITLPAAICAGNALALPTPTVAARGTAITAQTWKLNNVAYTAGTLLTYADNGKSLTFTASSACGDSIITVGNITVNAKPTVAPITLPAAICEGSALALPTPTVAARGTAITAQTWKLAGTAYTAGTLLTYADNGKSLTFTASSACGDSIVTVGNITVNAKPTVAPITLPAAICAGNALALPTPTVAARGTAITAQTWKLNGVAYTPGTNLAYTDNGKSLTFTASSACGDSVVTVGNITVYQTTAINTQPSVPAGIKLSNGYIIPGSIVPLSVAAVGHNLTYQWYWKKASDGSTVTLSDNSKYTGSTTASLTINNAYDTENGDYYVTVTGTCNTVTSTPVTIVAVANQDASLKDLKVNGTTLSDFNPGKTDYLLAISCDDEQVTILGTPNFAGVTSITGNGTFALQPGDNYFPITIVAQDMVTTRTYTVNVVRNCYVPKIKKDLDDAVICLNGTHTWTIEAEGENLTYEWYKGETRIMGQNTPSITFTDARFSDYDRYYVVVRSNHNGFKSSIQSKKVRLWVADYLPEHLRLSEYPNPATVGKNYHLKVDGYVDVTKYSWSYSKSGVTFSPAVTLYNDNETWATFGSLSVGTGTLKVTMEHPCGTRELTQTITVNYPTGVDDVTATVVTVYPNPTSGILKVSGTVANQMIRVTDVTGSLKGSYKTQEGITTIDLTGYAKGTYLVQYNGKAYKVIRK